MKKNILNSTGNSTPYSVMTYMGKQSKKEWIYVYVGQGNGNPLQYPCLGNPMNRGAWRATVHGVTKSWT